MTAVADEPLTQPTNGEGAAPEYVVTSSTSKAPAVKAVPVVEADDESRSRVKGRKVTRWVSGWCGPGPCVDGYVDAAGHPRRRCRGFAENGAKVTPRFVICDCRCHADVPEAAHPVVEELTPSSR